MLKRLLVIAACLIWTVSAWAQCELSESAVHRQIEDVLVVMKPLADRASVMRAAHAAPLETIQAGPYVAERWKVPDAAAAVETLSKRDDIVIVEDNWIGYQPHALPNDPLLPLYQWWIKSPTSRCGAEQSPNVAWCPVCPQVGDADVDLEHAWDIFTGNGSPPVGLIEFGEPDWSNPDLLPSRWENTAEINGQAGVDEDKNGYIDDKYGWDWFANKPTVRPDSRLDTHMAVTANSIGGGCNNGIYGCGGAQWNTKIIALAYGGTESGFISAIKYLNTKGVRVASMSFGASYSALVEQEMCNTPNILFVASAGNQGIDLDKPGNDIYPAEYNCSNVLTVGASNCIVNSNGFLNFNWGKNSVDLVAPGTNMAVINSPLAPGVCVPAGRAFSGCARGCNCNQSPCDPDDALGFGFPCVPLYQSSGTSYSTPLTAGVLNLGFGLWPAMPTLQARSMLLANVDVYPVYTNNYSSNGKLNAYRFMLAVQAAKASGGGGGGGGPGCPPACQTGPTP